MITEQHTEQQRRQKKLQTHGTACRRNPGQTKDATSRRGLLDN